MKTALRIFGIITVIIALFIGSLAISRAGDDKQDFVDQEVELAEAQKKLAAFKEEVKNMTGQSKIEMDQKIADAEKELAAIPSPSTYTILQVLYVGLILLTIAFAVFFFRPNLKLTTQLLIATVVLVLAAYFVSPDIKRGPYGGWESRTIALVTGGLVIATGLFAFLIAKKSAVKAYQAA